MPTSRPAPMKLVLLALGTLVASASAQQRDSTRLRPMHVTVKIIGDPTALYNGTYTANGIATKCGLADYGYPHRANSFAIMFPDDTATIAVTSVNFDADTLASNTTGHSFYLAVGIRIGQTGTPPLYVVRANDPQYAEPGTATRTTRAGVDSLGVVGVATLGRKVDVEMIAVCQP